MFVSQSIPIKAANCSSFYACFIPHLPCNVRYRHAQGHIAPELINIADRCLRRLNKKGNRLLLAGKHPNKVKVACAREMVGFQDVTKCRTADPH